MESNTIILQTPQQDMLHTYVTCSRLMTVTRDVLLVDQAKPDCLKGGTHEETLRPQVNPKGLVFEIQRSRGLKPIAQGSKNTLDCVERE